MGYWRTDRSGMSFSVDEDNPEMLWGDAPADLIGDAVDAVVETFQRDLDRPPTKSEIRAGLEFTLAPMELAD